jgi:hypothetical protein
MSILYITSDSIQTMMPPVCSEIFDGLRQVADVIPYGPGFPGFEGDRFPEVIGKCPSRIELVIVDENTLLESLSGFRVSSLAAVDIPKAHFVGDYHSAIAQRRDFCQRNRIDVIITRYEAGLPVLRTFGVPHIVHCPHTLNPDEIPAPPIERPYDVVVSGAMLPGVYPFRVRLYRLLSRCRDLRVLRIPHPGYCDLADLPPEALVRERYYAAIASARIGISTASIYKLPLRKYPEIAACGTIVAGDLPEHGIELIRDDMIVLEPEMPDEEIIASLRRGLGYFEVNAPQRAELAQHVISYYAHTAVARRLLRDIARCLAGAFPWDEEGRT